MIQSCLTKGHAMSSKTKIGISVTVGALLGVGGMWLFTGVQMRRMLSQWTSAALCETAADIWQIRSGQVDTVLERKEDALSRMIVNFQKWHAGFLSEDQRVATLWAAQRCYSDNPSLKMPPEVKAILDALPPRPPTSCDIQRAQARAASRPASRSVASD